MFTVDEYVVYGTAGVCLVKDIRKENFGGRKAQYYILQPIFDRDSMIYAPVDNEKVPIRRVISEDMLYALIHELPERKSAWIENDKLRNESFKETLRKGDPREIFFMVHDLYLHKFAQAEKGRKLHIADDNIKAVIIEMRLLKAAHLNPVLRIKLLCDSAGNAVKLHAVQPGAIPHIRRHFRKEVADTH